MNLDFFHIAQTINSLNLRLKERDQDAYISLFLGDNTWGHLARIRVNSDAASETPFGEHDYSSPHTETTYCIDSVEDLEYVLNRIDIWIDTIPDPETVAKQKAVKNLGRALDECRDAGIDTEAFDEPFANIYDNMLEYHP